MTEYRYVTVPGCDRARQPYRTTSLPEISATNKVGANGLLRTLSTTAKMQGFVLLDTGTDPEGVLDDFRETLGEVGLRTRRTVTSEISRDGPLHFDATPAPSKKFPSYAAQPTTGITMHMTPKGKGIARFFSATNAYMQAFADEENGTFLGPRRDFVACTPLFLEEDFTKGVIDPCYLNPEGGHTELGEGRTLFFRHAGIEPVYHQFETTDFPREAIIIQLETPDNYKRNRLRIF